MTQFLKAQEVADRLNIKIKTVCKWTCEKKIPHIKIGSSVRFREDDIEAWLKEHYKESV
jgi:excisionase family DNA binding protein